MIATNKETPKEVMVILSQYSASKCNTVKSISVKEKYLKKSNCFRETVVETVSSVVLFILFPEVFQRVYMLWKIINYNYSVT